jgi:hypothetical protein
MNGYWLGICEENKSYLGDLGEYEKNIIKDYETWDTTGKSQLW